ncbi:MAG: DMT family transporter [Verrucomicrobia bacterium]|nr:DMT family transporter [Verrucomicrobiota bacterium]
MSMPPKQLRALQMLVLANACWALSFPIMKAVALIQAPLLPQSSSWFIASATIVVRFSLAAVVMLFVCWPTLRKLTRLEIWEGVGLGVFAAAGLIFQMDGLAYTSASTSAFLTQFYCLLIPLIVAFRDRRWPTLRVISSCLMVIVGVGILSEVNLRKFHIGRGELETLIGSTIFTGQILWLQRPKFAANNVNHFTLVMFAVIALCTLPVATLTVGGSDDWVAAYSSAPIAGLMGVLTVFCTLGGYLLMNYWQTFLTATQAGLIYCLEPVFASLFALFLPGWFSVMARIDYPNEKVGLTLLLGGGLITIANALMQLQPAPQASATQDDRDRR